MQGSLDRKIYLVFMVDVGGVCVVPGLYIYLRFSNKACISSIREPMNNDSINKI